MRRTRLSALLSETSESRDLDSYEALRGRLRINFRLPRQKYRILLKRLSHEPEIKFSTAFAPAFPGHSDRLAAGGTDRRAGTKAALSLSLPERSPAVGWKIQRRGKCPAPSAVL